MPKSKLPEEPPWQHKTLGTVTSLEQILEHRSKAIGFVYLINHIPSEKKYIGRKLLFNKVKNKKVESNWKTYWSSSKEINELVVIGPSAFERKILVFVTSKGSLLYCEEFALYSFGVLESDQWYNQNIRSRVYRNWCKPAEATELRGIIDEIRA